MSSDIRIRVDCSNCGDYPMRWMEKQGKMGGKEPCYVCPRCNNSVRLCI